jgi:hypothetical protein
VVEGCYPPPPRPHQIFSNSAGRNRITMDGWTEVSAFIAACSAGIRVSPGRCRTLVWRSASPPATDYLGKVRGNASFARNRAEPIKLQP